MMVEQLVYVYIYTIRTLLQIVQLGLLMKCRMIYTLTKPMLTYQLYTHSHINQCSLTNYTHTLI